MLKILFALILGFVCFSINGQSGVKSGEYNYGKAKIAINPKDGSITGYFEEEIERSGHWYCSFYFEGIIVDDTFRIATGDRNQFYTQTPEPNGQIFSISENDLRLKLDDVLDADCWRVIQGAEDVGFDFHLSKEKKWEQVRIVKEKAYFHSEPNDSSKLKSYLLPADVFYVLKEDEEWLYSEFYGSKITRGWLKKSSIKEKRNLTFEN